MTAEIAILNKTAVALAADSAVTIEQPTGQKIYNTVNKLFALSKYHPVGVMVYGNADFMEIPWESIIKIYRGDLGIRKFDTLKEYSENFLDFIRENDSLFPPNVQERYFYSTILGYFHFMIGEIDKQVGLVIKNKGKIEDEEIEQIVREEIKKHHEEWVNKALLPSIPAVHMEETVKKYDATIAKAKEEIFQKLPLSVKSYEQLKEICGNLVSKDRFPQSTSGVVIAGFGNKDIFPSVKSFLVDGIANGKLKFKEQNEKSAEIGFNNTATIIPFAQEQMVGTFMEGMNPFLGRIIEDYLAELFDKYPLNIVENITKLNEGEKPILVKRLQEIGKAILKEFKAEMKNHRDERYVRPIIDAVAFLPKEELAAMAESLVNLTSFKQRISTETETVGGPIDVAIISKGDGLVWIKRKHYFKAELNQGFFANYYRRSEDRKEGKNGTK